MKDLLESRKEIDEIDDSIIRLFEKRMEVCKNVAEYKTLEQASQFLTDKESLIK